ncbi:hypothetical protein FACS1894199_06730 [Bacteroidia bacterium]|nr:hypothetical protein FACS1894199_06730 [Bacteroidia bacterium]
MGKLVFIWMLKVVDNLIERIDIRVCPRFLCAYTKDKTQIKTLRKQGIRVKKFAQYLLLNN